MSTLVLSQKFKSNNVIKLWRILALSIVSLLSWMTLSWAQSSEFAVGDFEPLEIQQGQALQASLRGRNLDSSMMISFSDPQIQVTSVITFTSAQELADSLGDRLSFTLNVPAGAMLGRINLIVTASDGTSLSKLNAFTVLEGSGAGNDYNDPTSPDNIYPGGDTTDPRYQGVPPRTSGQVNAITMASPPIGEIGGQVNLWIEGREFPSNPEVKFSSPGIDQAFENDQPLAIIVEHATDSSNGNMDGIYYKIRISPTTPLGPVAITVKDPATGSSHTQDGLFKIVPRGEGLNLNQQGSEDIEAVTGASPRVIRSGHNSAMWTYGLGFNIRSQIQFSTPTIREIRASEAVISAQNWPGYDGMRSYLEFPANTPSGPVDITVKNPNNTTATLMGAFEVVQPSSQNSQATVGTNQEPIPECNDDNPDLSVRYVGTSTPNLIAQGEEVTVQIPGLGFACRPEVYITGLGGVQTTSIPYRTTDPNQPDFHYLNFKIRVAPNAPIGPRELTVVNPNGSDKSNPQAFTIVAGSESSVGGTACSTVQVNQRNSMVWLIFTLLFGLAKFRNKILKLSLNNGHE